jgi:hypothetical protein
MATSSLNGRLARLEDLLPPPPPPPPDRWFPEQPEWWERRYIAALGAVLATMPPALLDEAEDEQRRYGSVIHPSTLRLFRQAHDLARRTADGERPTLALPAAVCEAVARYEWVEFADVCSRCGLELPMVPDRGALRGGPGPLSALQPIGAAHWFRECPACGGRVGPGEGVRE